MRITIVGTGYVGLVTGTCFAEMGNDVTCVDIDQQKVKQMQSGKVPIYEPGLEDLFKRNIKEGRLHFTTKLKDTVDASAIFLALPTPSGSDGSADLSYVLGVADELGKLLQAYTVIVDKSTVPVGTAEKVRQRIAKNAKVKFDVVSNPEFLREGQAILDFMKPERVVIGSSSTQAQEVMRQLYAPFVRKGFDRLIMTDEPSAEMIKYAANAFLATKISFMNQISGLCERVGADINMVRKGIGTDSRIGDQFLYPGPGYGGSCFPKDVLALSQIALEHDYNFGILDAVMDANDRQKQVIPQKVLKYYKDDINGRTFALWGLAFKDSTDDVRESPALAMIQTLTENGANVVAFDPQANENVKRIMGDNERLRFVEGEYDALKDADALVIATNWREFFAPDFERMKKLLKAPVIFDGRNIYDLATMKEQDFHYESIGRKTVKK
ncbi:MAG TPA: UDP-glucose/GDP-mannose dehydrogenase family protein [Candidatus Saccharimonadales bacterium]|nr:UDP-glucose/GDP-mannose dehydrogenase family protein [Candidatus Saccharimonadales bacterium]